MATENTKVVDKNNKTTWREVIEEENKFIRARRDKKKPIDINTKESKSGPEDLVGLAISGGGIRSASFALGVFEALKQKGLFKKIDYLSTVSGGGYIGAWLSANCYNNKDWLEKEKEKETETEKETEREEGTPWKKSIDHLRRYSNYLSPKLGLLSADTWSMVTVWLRNTLLIQIMILLSIAALLLGVKFLLYSFDAASGVYVIRGFFPTSNFTFSIFVLDIGTFFLFSFVAFYIILCLKNLNRTRSDSTHKIIEGQLGVQMLVIVLMLVSFLFSIRFWSEIFWYSEISGYRESLSFVCENYEALLLLLWVYVSSAFFVYYSIANCTKIKIIYAVLAPLLSTLVAFLLFAAIVNIASVWKMDYQVHTATFLAFAFMPVALLGTFAFGSVLLIGMVGRASPDYFREWWSRFGAWLAIYGFIWMVLVSTIFLGAWLTERYASSASSSDPNGNLWKDITAFGVWLGTVLTGLFSGKSADTNGGNQKGISTKLKEIVAKVAPAIFILGLLIAVSVVLHNIFAEEKNLESLIIVGDWKHIGSAFIICLIGAVIFAWRIDINEFSLNAFYRHRLTRCFLGASRQPEERNPHPFTGFDADDDLNLAELLDSKQVPPGPLHIINCSLNLGGSSDLSLHTRHSSNFILTPLYCGSSYIVKEPNGTEIGPVGYVETRKYGGEQTQPTLGQSISVSGAAASPNSGYHTSSSVSFLMTLFNARLGWWFPNPSKSECNVPSPKFSLKYILDELFGSANAKSKFLSISDGGHFENLAAYELIRRRCKVIIISDGECDPELQLEGLAALIRMCEVDGLAKIKIDTRAICSLNKSNWSNSRWAVGKITYPNAAADDKKNDAADDKNTGYLIYLKASMNGHENTPVLQYKATYPDFPHESTGDQFYSENQFESYRGLGKDITEGLFGKIKDIESESMTMTKVAEDLYSINAPQLVNEKQFIRNADQLMAIWRQLGTDKDLKKLAEELQPQNEESRPQINEINHSTFYMCSEMIQLMENVYLDMNLEDTWDHPDNEGWKKLFIEWAKTPDLNEVWKQTKHTYGERFMSFWERELKK